LKQATDMSPRANDLFKMYYP